MTTLTMTSMFFHLQYIHLFRPFLKYAPSASPLPAHVSPRRLCTANAGAISKLMRLYKKTYHLRQICNIAVYMIHSACTIHLLNLPEKSARRDITHGVKQLEEIAEDWLCARRTLSILSVLARKWRCELPEEAAFVLLRTDEKYGFFSTSDIPSPASTPHTSPMISDDGPFSTSQREYSPLSHYAQAHLNHLTPPAASIDDRMSMMPPPQRLGGDAGLPQQQQTAPGLQQGTSFDTGRIEISPDMLEGWARQDAGASTSGFDPAFLPANNNSSNSNGIAPSDGNSQCYTEQVLPVGQGANINGQNWILNDSARWHQNFQGWDIGGNLTTDSFFTFGHDRNGGTQQDASDISEPAPISFEGLTASLSGDGWLPGLD